MKFAFAYSGDEALTFLKTLNHEAILILSDINMPGMSGLEVCRALRAEPGTAECTILMLTSDNDPVDKVDAFSSGADDYILKPFSPRDLASRVHAAMRRCREAAEQVAANPVHDGTNGGDL